jgi:hypothetical protein
MSQALISAVDERGLGFARDSIAGPLRVSPRSVPNTQECGEPVLQKLLVCRMAGVQSVAAPLQGTVKLLYRSLSNDTFLRVA